LGRGLKMKDLIYTNEFLKKLEPFIVKNDLETTQKIKETLGLIAAEKIIIDGTKSLKLANMKTKTNDDIFMTEIVLKQGLYSLFWTTKDDKKIIITLTK